MDQTIHAQRLVPAVRYTDVLMVVQAVFQVLDFATTYAALQAGGLEANPVSRGVIEGSGWLAFGALKLLVAAAFLGCVPLMRSLRGAEGRAVTALSTVFAAFMLVVVVNNAAIAWGG